MVGLVAAKRTALGFCTRLALASLAGCCAATAATAATAASAQEQAQSDAFVANFVEGELFQLSGSRDFPNGAWCWFQDPRAIVDVNAPDGPLLVVASFSARDRAEYGFRPWDGSQEGDWAKGDNDIYWRSLRSGESGRTKVHQGLTQDDHNVGALLQLPDGRYLTAYADHAYEHESYYRVSERPHDPSQWGPVTTFTHGDTVTYSNLYTFPIERGEGTVVNFNRSVDYDPNITVSYDGGLSWEHRGLLLGGPGRPYVRYAQGKDTVHFLATDQHPRDFDNSVYHGKTDGRAIFNSRGLVIDPDVSDDAHALPEQLTRLHAGAPDAVGWAVDLEVDSDDWPYAVFSVQRNAQDRGNLPGLDHRYHYARFDGDHWRVSEIAYAGTSLYPIEQDYTGLAALDPDDPDFIVISTNVHPVSGEALVSRADGQRHWELFTGRTSDGGQSWTWTALTQDSTMDNIRPIIPAWEGDQRVILWMRGDYHSFHDWNTQIVGILQKGAEQ